MMFIRLFSDSTKTGVTKTVVITTKADGGGDIRGTVKTRL